MPRCPWLPARETQLPAPASVCGSMPARRGLSARFLGVSLRHDVHVHHAGRLTVEMIVQRGPLDATLLKFTHDAGLFIRGEHEIAHGHRLPSDARLNAIHDPRASAGLMDTPSSVTCRSL